MSRRFTSYKVVLKYILFFDLKKIEKLFTHLIVKL
jgi:hypothetical protein